MFTPSHWLLGAAAARRARLGRGARRALLWGAVAPDLPLIALVVGAALMLVAGQGMTPAEAAATIFERMYFENPWWQAAHNLLHAPPMLLALLLLAGVPRSGAAPWRRTLWYFALGCGLHTLVDIPLHHDDGPLLLWPFDWQLRFRSPVSYWDPQHHGGLMRTLELLLDGALLGYLLGPRLRRWWDGRDAP